MLTKKRKSRLDKLDEQIAEQEAKLKENPQELSIREALYELKEKQLTVLHRNIQVLDEFMRNEKENNYFREEEL